MSALTKVEIIEILQELKTLPASERLKMIDTTVHKLQADLVFSQSCKEEDIDTKLARAAQSLLGDYSNDPELTAFTALDGEAFHA
jgi:hypothetical protein